jgi:hypothetical protein
MISSYLTPDEVDYLRQRKVDLQAMNRRCAWRGHDDVFLSKLRQIYGLLGDFREIAVATFPESRVLIVTVTGGSGTLSLMFIPCQPEEDVRVESLFFSPVGRVPESLRLDVDVQPVIDATEDLLFRRAVGAAGGLQ